MSFGDNFEKLNTLRFDFRKYRSFFYNLNDNQANRDIMENLNS